MQRVEVFRINGEVKTVANVRSSDLPQKIEAGINKRIGATADELVDSEIVVDGLSLTASGGVALVKLVFDVKQSKKF